MAQKLDSKIIFETSKLFEMEWNIFIIDNFILFLIKNEKRWFE
mgnify:CR=1 FL=1